MKVVGIILESPNGIVVQHRDDIETITSPGQLSLFGGAMEGGETPIEGALRELTEETSLRLNLNDLSESVSFHLSGTRRNGEPFEREFYTFVAKIDSADFEVFEGQGKAVIPFDISTKDFQKLNLNAGAVTVLKHYLGVK